MPRTATCVRKGNTTIRTEGGRTIVTLYATDVVIIDRNAGTVVYNTGGYRTPTTVDRMRGAAVQFSLPRPPSLAEWRKMSAQSVTLKLEGSTK